MQACSTRQPNTDGIEGRWYSYDGGYSGFLDISPPSEAVLTIAGMSCTTGSYQIIKTQPFLAEITFDESKPNKRYQFSATRSDEKTLTLTRTNYHPVVFSRNPEAQHPQK